MSAKISGLVWELDLPRSDKYVLQCLADHAKHDGSDVYPSTALIAYKTGYEERQIQRIMKNLITVGILIMVRRGGGGPGKPNVYRIDLSKAKWQKPFEQWILDHPEFKSKGVKMSPLETVKGDISAEKGCHFNQKRVSPVTPEPSTKEPSTKEPSSSLLELGEIPSGKVPEVLGRFKSESDPRHHPIREEIKKRWLQFNPKFTACPWKAEAGILGRVLRDSPKERAESFLLCVRNRFASDVNHSEPPRMWLGRIISYLGGPLDQFGKPKQRQEIISEGETSATEKLRRQGLSGRAGP